MTVLIVTMLLVTAWVVFVVTSVSYAIGLFDRWIGPPDPYG